MAVPAHAPSYTHDPAGNCLTQTVNGVTTTFTYNSASQLLTETSTGKGVVHEYDTWGNETTRTNQSTGAVETFLLYNHLNLLSAYTHSTSGASLSYDYDHIRQ